jgi:hypothetical protein
MQMDFDSRNYSNIDPSFSIHLFNLEQLGKYGTVGDTIGGITSPVSQLLGSILIYLALKAQLDANKIIQNQVNEDNKQSLIRRFRTNYDCILFPKQH